MSDQNGKLKYYKSCLSGLSVVVGEHDPAHPGDAPKSIRFVPYVEKFEGDKVYVGYLATQNEVAHTKLAVDPNVEEIDKDEFEKATKSEKAQRAAY